MYIPCCFFCTFMHTHTFCLNAKSHSTVLFERLITAIKLNLGSTVKAYNSSEDSKSSEGQISHVLDDSTIVTATWWTSIEKRIPISETLKHGVIKCILESVNLCYVQTIKVELLKVFAFNHFYIVECVMTSMYFFSLKYIKIHIG